MLFIASTIMLYEAKNEQLRNETNPVVTAESGIVLRQVRQRLRSGEGVLLPARRLVIARELFGGRHSAVFALRWHLILTSQRFTF